MEMSMAFTVHSTIFWHTNCLTPNWKQTNAVSVAGQTVSAVPASICPPELQRPSRDTLAVSSMLKQAGPKAGGFYDAELTELLKIAWLEKGIDSIPVFGKLNGRSGYFWQEELI